MGLGSLVGGGAGFMLGGPTGAMLGASLGDSILGSGNRVAVPSSIAKPTQPNILGQDDFVKDQFRLSGYTPDSQNKAYGLLGNLNSMATQVGPTDIAQRLSEKNQLESKNLADQAIANEAQSRATNLESMAMKGGIGSGSRERLAGQGQLNLMNTNQNIANNKSINNMSILADDEQRKFGLLSNLPNQYLQHAQMDVGKKQFDIGNSINTSNNIYSQGMQAWGANQMAIAQANAANKASGGLLGLF